MALVSELTDNRAAEAAFVKFAGGGGGGVGVDVMCKLVMGCAMPDEETPQPSELEETSVPPMVVEVGRILIERRVLLLLLLFGCCATAWCMMLLEEVDERLW